jgi:hypothetical protein
VTRKDAGEFGSALRKGESQQDAESGDGSIAGDDEVAELEEDRMHGKAGSGISNQISGVRTAKAKCKDRTARPAER